MNRNYETERSIRSLNQDLDNWAESRETALPVAIAIHAIADSSRSAQEIWESPTPTEFEHVTMAVSEYVQNGDFDYDEDGYSWGCETVKIENPANV